MALTLTGISPNNGPVEGGTAVTLTGTDFNVNGLVTIGGVELSAPIVVSGTSITGVTSAHAAGAVDVVVTQVTEYGTWTQQSGPGAKAWSALCCSDDGQFIAMTVGGSQTGFIYTTIDGGANWSERAINTNWFAIACSGDGTKLIATREGATPYQSTDSGATWTNLTTKPNFRGIACSSDGTKWVGVVLGGQIHTSTDSGATWTARDATRNWYRVASSADGTVLLACVYGVGNYCYLSTDSGVTWTQTGTMTNCRAVAVSGNGLVLYITVSGGYVYRSTDGGASWTQQSIVAVYNGIACSRDGTIVVTADNQGMRSSIDAGSSWGAYVSGAALAVAYPVNRTYAYAISFARNLFRSAASFATATLINGFTYIAVPTHVVTRLAVEVLSPVQMTDRRKPQVHLIL